MLHSEMLTMGLLAGGLLALYFGAEWLVRGSSALALRLGLTPLLVGLTVVAYGTSAPELIVSLAAAMSDQSEIAVGNAIGSNIVNIGLILGLTAVLCPLKVHLQVLKLDTPVMVAAALLFLSCDALGVAPYAKSWGAPFVVEPQLAPEIHAGVQAGDKGLTSPTPTGPSIPRHGSALATRYPALP